MRRAPPSRAGKPIVVSLDLFLNTLLAGVLLGAFYAAVFRETAGVALE